MKQIIKYKEIIPKIHPDVFVADGAKVIGDVNIGKGTNIWFNCVLRADVNYIKIGQNTNIQDGTVIHVSSYGFSAKGEKGCPTEIGSNVTIGHNATIHACTIENFALIGMGSVILDQAVIKEYSLIAAGALVTPGSRVNERELWAGNPAKFIRKITDVEEKLLVNTPKVYLNLSKDFLKK